MQYLHSADETGSMGALCNSSSNRLMSTLPEEKQDALKLYRLHDQEPFCNQRTIYGMSQFWPPKITFKFLGKSWNNFEVKNVQYLLKYDTLYYMYMIQIFDVKNYDFSIIVKNCKKRCRFLPLYSFRKYRATSQTRFILRLYTYVTDIHRW